MRNAYFSLRGGCAFQYDRTVQQLRGRIITTTVQEGGPKRLQPCHNDQDIKVFFCGTRNDAGAQYGVSFK